MGVLEVVGELRKWLPTITEVQYEELVAGGGGGRGGRGRGRGRGRGGGRGRSRGEWNNGRNMGNMRGV